MQDSREDYGYANNGYGGPGDSDHITRRQAIDILSDDSSDPILRERAQEAIEEYDDDLQFGMVDESGLS
jgi:hypothetical protein